ncbi:MAG: ATP phosphoribosyltransferase regulatory subunit, partial [Nitrospirae bacterium]|nr:ATP phosphoribosyltransferase regulatory subunit [Nitrospirota bacterium]
MSGIGRHHAEWLSLIETSGPFLTLPVLVRVFPQGLPKPDTEKLGRLRAGYEEWAKAQESRAPDAEAVHGAWVRLVLGELLEFDEETLRSEGQIPSGLEVRLPEYHETLRPSMTIVEPSGRTKAGTPRLLIESWPFARDLDAVIPGTRWAASPLDRMTHLCRTTGVRLGLVTNGERWTLIDAPAGQATGYASWYAGLWFQEPLTLAAFEALLGVRRFFGVSEADTLEAMLDESVAYQQEVTDQLGYQVRRAVEVLVQALDRADLDRQRELLPDVSPDRLYEASLTVMMRLVFLFCAEERGLLLLGDETYDGNYAVSTLRAQLRKEADRVGVEVLERRQDAWARLLATFRAVYGGIEHETLRLPALGGSLFDPDRFPFLEGRPAGTSWLDTPASPLPIDNRTVLHLLDALQLLRMRGDNGASEARKLSYLALDIEQIGHVYEGLLDHVAVRVNTDTLGLVGTKDKEPELSIDDLDRERDRGKDELIAFLKEHTGRAVSALRNDLDSEPDEEIQQRLLVACGNDHRFLERALPYHALIRSDVWGYPQVYRAGSFMVTGGPERRQTGTHYTPKPLTEKIVAETLEPLVYVGPAEGKPPEEWKLRSPAELLDLKICDMAMGSAAFLVQVCRWLGERLVESWDEAERNGATISADGEVLEKPAGQDLLPKDREERLSLARRLIAERCIYGVDINPMAVELAKLSLWLITLAKGRPFGFLDHNLRCGDSLLGIVSLDQLENFHLDPERGKVLHHSLFDPRHHIQNAVQEALELRKRLRSIRILDIEDVRAMARLDTEARRVLEQADLIADLLIGAAIASAGGRADAFDEQLAELAHGLRQWLNGEEQDSPGLSNQARQLLETDCPERVKPRRPFHWTVEFPEVFERGRGGFDAIVGNPPFMGGQKLTGNFGTTYREYLVAWLAGGKRGSADLVAYFFLRAYGLLPDQGNFGLLAVNTIAEGDTRQVGLEQLVANGAVIFAAYPNEPWPGKAAVATSRVHVHKGAWQGVRSIFGRPVPHISAFLSDRVEWTPKKLKANEGIAFQGSIVLGMGFIISEEEARALIRRDPRNEEVLFPYLNGEDLNSNRDQKASRWIINFWDWSEEKAQTYREPYEIVKAKVKPERQRRGPNGRFIIRRARAERWWQYGELARGLYHAIGRGEMFEEHPSGWHGQPVQLSKVLVCSIVSKHLAFAKRTNREVFAHRLAVFAQESDDWFGFLSSSINEVWARKFSSSLETRMNYSPSDAFETLPLPLALHDGTSRSLNDSGSLFHEIRQAILGEEGIGLTDFYNKLHDEQITNVSIDKARNALIALDNATSRSFG